jgi:hypothetical protein
MVIFFRLVIATIYDEQGKMERDLGKFALSRLAKARTTGIANNQCKTHWKFLFSVTKLPKVFKRGIMQSELLEQFLGGVV